MGHIFIYLCGLADTSTLVIYRLLVPVAVLQ